MTFSTIQNSFIAGEISPSLYGRTDLAKWRNGASTMRNFFANYRGGAASRAGFAYVGTCKQPGTSAPPRDIPFQFNINQGYALEFGDQYMRIKSNGAYVTETNKNIQGATQANPAVIQINSHGYSVGDWIFISGMGGMTNFNGLTWIVNTTPDANHVTLKDLFGNVVDSTAFSTYTSGGTAARIYTVVAPYAAVDLPYLKFTQSSDTMSLNCVNIITLTEYPPYDLKRNGATNWVFTQLSFASSIAPPTGVAVAANSSTTVSTWYSYVVTAIDSTTGQESVASLAATVENNDIAVNAGSNVVTWNPVVNASSYNVYKATPSYSVGVPIGVLYGFAGSSLGPSFTDNNITADFTQVPPIHADPFARGTLPFVTMTNGGTGYAQNTVGYTVNTSTGSGFVGTPIVLSGIIVDFLVINPGKNYAVGDTITITGAHTIQATAVLTVGPETGTYPSTVTYFQQRRAYANTLNQPDTYFMSQPGAFLNMDSSIPVTDSDAITGSPWAQQVNGIQFMVPMPNGLVVLTGKGAWLLNGGNSAAITPADQTAQAQAYNGCNSIVPPLTINYDILYVQTKGSIVRDLAYNFFTNIYTGTDMTVLSNHLFTDHQVLQWAWAEEPYKLVWCVREDGIMLSLTYLKEQDVYSWARHDTNGFFVSVCSITEPPVDAVYSIVKRYVQSQWMYYSERMNNRDWPNVESCFCADSGLQWPMTFPNAILTPASATGISNITNTNIIQGGSGLTSPTITAVDPTGKGSGAAFSGTLTSGVLTGITVLDSGEGYAQGTKIQVSDPTGTGVIVQPIITNNVVFTASTGVFSAGNVGNVIRIGGGKATVVAYTSTTQVTANITQAITDTVPNDPNNIPVPAISGDWSITPTTSTVTGLNHLEGLTVAILADGSVVTNQAVINGTITLPQAYSAIIIGLPYLPQLQTLYLDPVGQPPTVQGKRKDIYAVTVRMEASRGMMVGTNQPDASTQPNNATVAWTDMKEFKERNARVHASTAIPLFTGDERILVPADWQTNGQVAIQQNYPLPANVLAVIPEYQIGDTSG